MPPRDLAFRSKSSIHPVCPHGNDSSHAKCKDRLRYKDFFEAINGCYCIHKRSQWSPPPAILHYRLLDERDFSYWGICLVVYHMRDHVISGKIGYNGYANLWEVNKVLRWILIHKKNTSKINLRLHETISLGCVILGLLRENCVLLASYERLDLRKVCQGNFYNKKTAALETILLVSYI